MDKYNAVGLTQRVISEMSEASLSATNRYITGSNIPHLESGSVRNLKYSIEDARKMIYEFYSKKFEVTKKVQAFYNFKGGTGKTSMCFQVSSHLALMGFNVLVVDADPQGHLSTSLGFNTDSNILTLYDAVTDKVGIRDVIQPVFPGLDCIPSNLSLTRLEVALNPMPKREERVSIAFEPIEKNYDFILFDTNPTISHLNRNVITYSDLLNIVCETQPYSLNGLKLLFEDLGRFYNSMQMEKADVIVIPNKYEDRTASSAEAMTVLREYYSEYMKPDFAIRKSEDINTAAKIGLPLATFCKKNSIAFADIMELIRYLLNESCNQIKIGE